MNKRVFGIIGIKSVMANWNADFSGYPKSISTGEVFGSDKALKYPMKRMWEDQGKTVLYIKSLKIEEDKKKKGKKIRPKSLKERYGEIFKCPNLKEEKDSSVVLRNLFTAIDVKQFGATFAEEDNNISITGAVQIGQGFNKYENTSVEEQQILSPFRVENEKNKKEDEEANSTTLGTKIVSSEAHYFYPFVINPLAYKNYVAMGVTEGYTEEDYNTFKEAAIISATALNTNSKLGCENELAVFIETEEETYLPDLAQLIKFEKRKDKGCITFGFVDLLKEIEDQIIKIEVYYNPYTTILEGELVKAKYYNIFTRNEVLK